MGVMFERREKGIKQVMSAKKQVCGLTKPDYTTQLNSEMQKFPRNPSTLSNSSLEDSYVSLVPPE